MFSSKFKGDRKQRQNEPAPAKTKEVKEVVVSLPEPTSLKSIKFVQYPWEMKSHWRHIMHVLENVDEITSVEQVQQILAEIKNDNRFDAGTLKWALNKMNDEEKQNFYRTFRFIIDLVKESPLAFKDFDLRVLTRYPIEISDECITPKVQKVVLNRHQIACLLANAFLSTYQRRNGHAFMYDHHIPSINFDSLFSVGQSLDSRVAKILMIIHYFERIAHYMPTGLITFTRQSLIREDIPDWSTSNELLTDIQIFNDGVIEDAEDALQAGTNIFDLFFTLDFANQFIGGGVLGGGAVQEEIRFCNNPECIVSRLFCEEMASNEAVIITGTEQFSDHSGYGQTLTFKGDHQDTNHDIEHNDGRMKTEIVAFDAIIFMKDASVQWQKIHIDRELEKAFAAFYSFSGSTNKIATGNWG
jgi:hypothetical protein